MFISEEKGFCNPGWKHDPPQLCPLPPRMLIGDSWILRGRVSSSHIFSIKTFDYGGGLEGGGTTSPPRKIKALSPSGERDFVPIDSSSTSITLDETFGYRFPPSRRLHLRDDHA